LQSAGTTAVTIDTSQNVGIGTTSPTAKAQIGDATVVSSNRLVFGKAQTAAESNLPAIGQQSFGGNGNDLALATTSTSGVVRFYTGASTNSGEIGTGSNTERMRINSSGNVILGSNTSTTANNVLNLYSPTSTLNGIYLNKGSQVECQIGFKTGTGTDFFIGTGSTTMGTNGVYLTNTGNSWTSVSDERQKDIIEPIENGLIKVNALRAVIGKYKHDADGVRRSFLIAQDVQAVFPEAVKVQEDEEALLGLSYTDVIPLLVASIKELKAINDTQAETINALTARIEALEGK
jgi:hypothetical protein